VGRERISGRNKLKNTYRLYSALLFIALLAGCASAPKLTQEQIFSQYPQIASLDKGLKDAAAQGVDNLAPEGYRAAIAKLEEAVSEVTADRAATATAAASAGGRLLEKANQDAEVTRDVLREVLEARERARKAGAPSLYSESMADLDNDLRKAASLVERGKLEDVKQRRPKLLAGYEQLELAALKEGMVDAAKAAIDKARENGAPKTAPKTFKLAREEMDLALSILDADRTDTEKANVHARRAKWVAEQSSAITELIKDFDRRDYTREDVVLWYQSQLSEINEPIGSELPFNERNRNVVLSMQKSIKDLMRQRDDTAAARSQYEQELSMTAEQRSAVDKVQSLFTPAEANVFQQRRNVLISAHGFRFPPGGSELETQNFVLLNKIIQAINTFPDSRINVSGHTDSTGSAAINQTLSELRAGNVAKFLSEVGGISAERISVNGYGKERPVASNETAEGRAANRRVEILIINK
jgi:outer membrane protein OmpA-like peptidoglycan-associated protein